MPNFGAQLEDARLNFYNPDRELISKNIKDTEAVHNNAMKAYSDMNAAILKDDTLHPDERTKRLKRLEDKVFKDINSFSGNTAQASDTILNSIINESKDPFYNLDKQYTNVYNAAQANRAKLEAEGKSAFMRDAYGNEIDALPTLFDKDGNMRSQQDFQFDYEGILDYSAKAETLFNDIKADIYAVAPQLVRNPDEVSRLIGDFIRTGSVETTDQNVKNVLNKALKDYQQSSEYDQLRRRGMEGSAMDILKRAAEEVKYTKEHKVDKLLNELVTNQRGSGGNDPDRVGVNIINASSTPIIGTEAEAKLTNNIAESVNDEISGIWTSKGWGTQYSDNVVVYENNKLIEKKYDVGGREIATPLTKSRATIEIDKLSSDIVSKEKELESIYNRLGVDYTSYSELGDRINAREGEGKYNNELLERFKTKLTPKDYEYTKTLLSNVDRAIDVKTDITKNIPNLEKYEKGQLSKYKTTIDNLLSSGLVTDTQEAIMFIKNYEANNALKDRKEYNLKAIDKDDILNAAMVDEVNRTFLDKDSKFIVLPDPKSGDEDSILDSDGKIKIITKDGSKSEPTDLISGDNKPAFTKGATVNYSPKLGTFVVNGKYAIDPSTFKNKYASLASDAEFLTTVQSLSDLTEQGVSKVKTTYGRQGDKGLSMIIDGVPVSIPAGAVLNRKIINTDKEAVEIVEVINPKNKAVSRYRLSDFTDAANEAVTEKIFTYMLPEVELGKMKKALSDSRDVIPTDFSK